MRLPIKLLCLAAVGIGVCALATPARGLPGDDEKEELKKLQGNWNLMQRSVNGKVIVFQKGPRGPARIVIKDNTIALAYYDGLIAPYPVYTTEQGTFTLDTKQNPKAMDITFTETRRKEKTAKLIYQLEGDSLKIAELQATQAEKQKDTPRPKTFDQREPRASHILFSADRDKK
jgi:uncharacterized protein (TIGR03067 family)